MLEWGKQAILSKAISLTVHRFERLNEGEEEAQNEFMTKLKISKRKTGTPVIVALIGLVGSGKSTVARKLASLIGATVVGGDEIRVELRKKNQSYDRARLVAENTALEILKSGGNVIMDSEHLDSKKSASLRVKAKKTKATVLFVRVFADYDVMAGRIVSADYQSNDFFGGASSKWNRSIQDRGVVVKLREMWRRTPNHYRWVNKVGGKWILKLPQFKLFAKVDTTDEKKWPKEIEKIANKITAQF